MYQPLAKNRWRRLLHLSELHPETRFQPIESATPFWVQKGVVRKQGVCLLKFLWAAGPDLDHNAQPNFIVLGVGPASSI